MIAWTLTPGASPLRESFRKLLRHLAFFKNEGFESDRLLGAMDRAEHRRENLVAVAERGDAVSAANRSAEHMPDRLAEGRTADRAVHPSKVC